MDTKNLRPAKATHQKLFSWTLLASFGVGALIGAMDIGSSLPSGIASTPAGLYRGPASYDHVVTWSDMSDLDLRVALRSQYGSSGNMLETEISESSFEIVLRDADNRIQPEFRIPAELRASVGFWLRIYTQYTTQHSVIFDSRHPELIYEVLDFRDLAKTARNAIVYEIVSKKRIKNAMEAYRKALHRLAKGAKPKTREERIVAQAVKKLKHKHSLNELAQNVRSQTGQRDNIMKGLIAAEAFFPRMESVFKEVGIPTQLTRLALVESSFDLRAQSHAGAAGVWQFMPSIGAKFLKIDRAEMIDERLSPMKSTLAAGKLLRENYTRFKNWPLAITSYNHGLKGLPRANRQIAEADEEFARLAPLFKGCNKRSPLGWAGRNYYSEFLAALHAESYRQIFYGEPPVQKIRAVSFKLAPAGQTALSAAMFYNVSIHEFKLMNPDIKDLHRKLPRNFYVAIPADNDDLSALLGNASRKRLARRL